MKSLKWPRAEPHRMSSIRRATLKDLDLLVTHRQRMWESMGKFSPPEHAAANRSYRRWLRPRLRSGSAVGFVVTATRGRPVASGVVWLMDFQPRPGWRGAKQAYLMSVYTEPDQRRRGHATRITRAAMRWAKSNGIERMALHASRDGGKLYAPLGFRRTHEMRIAL